MVTPLQETDNEADGIAQLLAHGRQAWWDRDNTQLLDNLVRRSITKRAAVLAGLGKRSMGVYEQSKDYGKEQEMLDPLPPPRDPSIIVKTSSGMWDMTADKKGQRD